VVAEVARAHVVARGRVQGVGFRFETEERARSLALAGWVRNNPDGTVEAVFEGPRERVESMVRWCAHGPRGAVVQEVDTRWEQPRGEHAFTVR
jgi:acylphosphatase